MRATTADHLIDQSDNICTLKTPQVVRWGGQWLGEVARGRRTRHVIMLQAVCGSQTSSPDQTTPRSPLSPPSQQASVYGMREVKG